MRLIDIDPDLLHASADAAMHAAKQANVHIDAEVVGDIPALVKTLTVSGPYAYAIRPVINADGSIDIPIAVTRESVAEWYAIVRGHSGILPEAWPIVEVCGEWFTFQQRITLAQEKATGVVHENDTILLLPVTSGPGITGELTWFRAPRESLGRSVSPSDRSTEPIDVRKHSLELHDRYLRALRDADVEGVLEVLNDDAQSGIRDYVDDTGTVIALRNLADHRHHYGALFEKFEIRAVDLLHRVVQDWYVFAEMRVKFAPRGTPDALGEVRIAEFFIPASDGRFIARLGHGTDIAGA
jgi:hypothetical protein